MRPASRLARASGAPQTRDAECAQSRASSLVVGLRVAERKQVAAEPDGLVLSGSLRSLLSDGWVSCCVDYGLVSRLFPDAAMMCVGQGARMSTLQGVHHVSKRRVVSFVIGVALAFVGLLWFLQGAGTVHVRPILCVSNCKPVTQSTGWLIAGVIACMVGVAIAVTSARHLRRR